MPKLEVKEPMRHANVEGMFVGLNKGHRVTRKPRKALQKVKKSQTSRNKFIRELVHEIVGLSPYEKRATELLKSGKDKRTLKFLKRRLGGHKRGKKKRDELQSIMTLQRQKGPAQ